MCFTNDPVADFLRHDAKQEKWLDSLPKCTCCKEPIQDEYYYDIGGDLVCEEHLKDYCDKRYLVKNKYGDS